MELMGLMETVASGTQSNLPKIYMIVQGPERFFLLVFA